jgi:DNA-binding GntR family transcriptional regulator
MSWMAMAAPEGLFALEGRTTAQLIADQLREQIVQRSLRPGQQINESILAAQLNTSRSPVREALQRLCREGILIRRRNHGVFVKEVETHDLREIYEVRESVESAAASRLLDGSPKADQRHLRSVDGNCGRNGEASGHFRLADHCSA